MQEEVFTYPLGQHSTVFQAELFAILACVNELRLTNESSIVICSDIQAALKSVIGYSVTATRLYGDQKSHLDWWRI